ncbi:MAG TPA: hypothetical protein VHX15_02760 [Frankiaceae bacterium]|jgi:hypothetical protein|nr:hypothetical protein [Frankiaceae bacterium]
MAASPEIDLGVRVLIKMLAQLPLQAGDLGVERPHHRSRRAHTCGVADDQLRRPGELLAAQRRLDALGLRDDVVAARPP